MTSAKYFLISVCFLSACHSFSRHAANADDPQSQIVNDSEVVIEGRFVRTSGPCVPGPNGSRRRLLRSGITIDQVRKGIIGTDYIGFEYATLDRFKLGFEQEDQRYTVTLRPSKKTYEQLKTRDSNIGYMNTLPDEEIVSIVDSSVSDTVER